MSEYGDAIDDLMTEDDSVFSQSATAQAVAGIDAEPDSAARAIQLARATRAPAPVINADLEGFEKRQKANLVGDMVRNSPALQKYVNGYPLANQVSNDDYPALHNLQATVAKTYLTAMDRGWKGLKDGWGDAPPVAQVSDKDVMEHPTLSFLYMTIANPFALAGRAFTAAIHGGAAVAGSYAESLAGEHVGKAVEKEVGGMLEWAMMRGDLGTIKQQVHPDAVKQARKVIDAAAPYLQAGEMPPPGVHPMIDQLHAEVAKEDAALMKDAVKAAQDSKTRERSPEAAEHFLKTTTEDRDIGISADAVRELYGEKAPLPDDGKLGWIPDLENQLRMAEQTGSDIQVPLSKFLANIDPALAKELEEHLRLRTGGMTLKEAEASKEAKAADPMMRPEPVGVEDYARREASLEPLAQVGRRDVRLEKASSEVDKYGQTFDTFHITDEGNPIGTVTINETLKGVLYVENIEVTGGANVIGPHAVRALMEGIKREYPNAKSMGGYRVSGARTGTKAEADWVQTRLDKSPEEMAQFFGNIAPKGWDVIEGFDKPEGTIKAKLGNADVEFRPSELLDAKEAEIADAIQKIGKQLAPGLDIFTVDKASVKGAGMEVAGDVRGLYMPEGKGIKPYIIVALKGPDGVGTLLHEVIHHLRGGFFSTAEWSALEKSAKDKGWIEKHQIDKKYPEAPEWLRVEEAVAEEYRAWSKEVLLKTERSAETVAAFQKLKEFFAKIKTQLEDLFGPGITADKLFAQVSAGEVGGRKPSAVGGSRFGSLADALAQAKEVEEAKMFEKGAAIGMTQAQFKKYLSLMDEQRAETEARAKRRAERAVEVTKTEEWKQNESSVRAEVTDAVNTRPDVVADEFFRKGMIGDQRVKRQKMDPKYLTEEQRKALGPDLLAEGGINPDSVAGLFGFVSGDRMVTALASMKVARDELKMTPQAYKNQMVKDQFQATMMKRYGLPEHDALLKEAREDIVTETAMDMLAEETLALATKAGEAPPMSKADMKSWVKDEFRSQPAKQGKDMVGYLHDAGRAGRAAEDALLKGDAFEAFRQKQRQYIAMLASQEAKAFAKEAARFDKTLSRFSARSLTAVQQDYTDQVHGIMRQINRPAKRSVQDLNEALAGTTLEKFVANKEADLRELPVAEFLYDPAWTKPFDEMTVGEARDVARSIQTLAHNGAQDLRVEKAGEKRDLQEVKNRMVEQLETFPAAKAIPLDQGRGKLLGMPTGGVAKMARTFVAAHLQMENLFRRWDRWDKQGDFAQYIMRPLAEGTNTLAAMERKYSRMLMDLRDDVNLSKVIENPILRDPMTGDLFVMTRRNLRAVMANMGNASNFDKLAKGYKVTGDMLNNWVHEVATKEDWDFAQAQGKIFAEIFKESARMYERLSGVAPEKVELRPIQTKFGEYEGWYHPIIYDRLREGSSKTLMGKSGIEEPEYYRATTAAGYTKERTGYSAPLSLNPDLAATRMKQMLNDIAMREPVINAGKFFYDKDVRGAIAKHSALGPEVRDGLIPYLKDVANVANIDSAAASIGAQWSEFFRQNIVSTLIGLNPGTVMKHGSTALVQSLQQVGGANFLRETKNLLNRLPSGETNWRFAMDTSEELQRRHRHYQETLGGGYQEAFQEPTLRSKIQHINSWPVAMSDLLSAVPTWLAEYRKQMEAGATKGDAIFTADQSVRLAHGSTAVTNRAAIMRGGAMSQWFTSLFGFFSHIMNRQVELVWRAKDVIDNLKAGDKEAAMADLPELKGMVARDGAKALTVGLFAYVLWPALVEELVTPLPHDEKEGWAMWAGKAVAKDLSASWVGVRDIAAAVVTGHDPSSGLVGTMFKAGTDVARDVTTLATKGGDRAGAIIKHGSVALGALTGLSNAQIGKTGEFTYNWLKGRDRPRKLGGPLMTTPDSVLRGIRYGQSKPARR